MPTPTTWRAWPPWPTRRRRSRATSRAVDAGHQAGRPDRSARGSTDRQEQVVSNAENIDPPGPLREAHRGAVERSSSASAGSTDSSRPSAGPQRPRRDAGRDAARRAGRAARRERRGLGGPLPRPRPAGTAATGHPRRQRARLERAAGRLRPREPALDDRARAAPPGRGCGRHADGSARHRHRLDGRPPVR